MKNATLCLRINNLACTLKKNKRVQGAQEWLAQAVWLFRRKITTRTNKHLAKFAGSSCLT